MKRLLVILCCFLGAKTARGVMAMPFIADTNQLAATYVAARANEAIQRNFLLEGKMGRLEHELDRLEAEFLILTVLVGSAGAAVCLLATRDLMRKRAHACEKDAVRLNEKGTVVAPAASSGFADAVERVPTVYSGHGT